MIELAHRPGRVLERREHVIERARLVIGAAPRIGILRIVEHLVFEADYILLPLGRPVHAPTLDRRVHAILEPLPWDVVGQHHPLLYAVLHAAIAAWRNLPLDRKSTR